MIAHMRLVSQIAIQAIILKVGLYRMVSVILYFSVLLIVRTFISLHQIFIQYSRQLFRNHCITNCSFNYWLKAKMFCIYSYILDGLWLVCSTYIANNLHTRTQQYVKETQTLMTHAVFFDCMSYKHIVDMISHLAYLK